MSDSEMQVLAYQTALFFRLGMDAKANDTFAKFMDSLAQQLPSLPSHVDVNSLNHYLNQMFLAQSRADYLYLADLLEYEIGPQLQSFP